MKLEGERIFDLPQKTLWAGLNTPKVLESAIPGCQSLDAREESNFSVTAQVKLGPIKTIFLGDIELHEVNAPHSYRLKGKGKGGAAGFASGEAHVSLTPIDDNVTNLTYQVEAKVGGKLAQIGSRLVTTTARELTEQFFENLATEISKSEEMDTRDPASGNESEPAFAADQDNEQPAGTEEIAPEADISSPLTSGLSPWVWSALVIIAVAVLLIALS
ncbi:MAG: carbon monoxide dehydrogenase subunit G [Pseudomonadota bacterium]